MEGLKVAGQAIEMDITTEREPIASNIIVMEGQEIVVAESNSTPIIETNFEVFGINDNLEFYRRNNNRFLDSLDGELVDTIDMYGFTDERTVKLSQKLDRKIVKMQKQFNRIKKRGFLEKVLAFNRQLDIKEVIARVEQ